ncbi:MAG: hypothetical protein ACPLOC_07820 [Candidatus Bathyarchaeales archaeon]
MSNKIYSHERRGKQEDSFQEFDDQVFTALRIFLGVKKDGPTDQKDMTHMKLKMGCSNA